MRFKNIARWDLTPETESLLFFAQRMTELLWDYTLDTHKPMALNAPFLCAEALQVISNIEAELIEPANLQPVLEELLWSIRHDSVAKHLLDSPVDQYVLMHKDVKPHEQKVRLSALERTLHPRRYLHRCFDELTEKVHKNKKKDVDVLARSMVTTLINMGCSKRGLYVKTNDFFFAAEGKRISAPSDIEEFLLSLSPVSHSCTVYFSVSGLVRTVQNSLSPFKVKILDELPPAVHAAANGEFSLKADECYVSVGPIDAFDVYSAQEIAARRLDSISDLFTLFYHQQKIAWGDTAIVEQCCLDKPVLTRANEGAMNKPFDLPPDKASKELNRLLKNFQMRGASFERFARVADLHGISVSSDVADNQLVTIWTSLETLIPSRTNSSKIVNILESTVPFLMKSYLHRIVQRFAHDLFIWGGARIARKILHRVPDLPKGAKSYERALALLAVDSNEGLRTELYGLLRDFHLLRFRAFQLREIFSSPQVLKETLKNHEQKVRWQIRRIYRTRNMLVHSGKRPTYIRSLIENGHDYLDCLIFDVMKLSCGDYHARTLDEAFEIAKIQYNKFNRSLNEITSFTAANCKFLCDDFDSLDQYVGSRWLANAADDDDEEEGPAPRRKRGRGKPPLLALVPTASPATTEDVAVNAIDEPASANPTAPTSE